MAVVLGRKPGGGGTGAPSGPAGGDLSGTYPDPDIAANAVGTTEIADGAVTIGKLGTGISVLTTIFDTTLGADTASIDTGANSIAAGFQAIEFLILARVTGAVVVSSVAVTVNSDGGANYDQNYISANGVGATATADLAGTSWNSIPAPGANAQAGAVGLCRFLCLGYDQTTFHKVFTGTAGFSEDTAADNRTRQMTLRWRNTAAITRITVGSSSGNLAAGSRLVVYGIG